MKIINIIPICIVFLVKYGSDVKKKGNLAVVGGFAKVTVN